jgi:hypothetical protein
MPEEKQLVRQTVSYIQSLTVNKGQLDSEGIV